MNHVTKQRPPFLMGVDIGGTKTEAVVVGMDAGIQGQARQPTGKETAEALVERTVAVIRQALAQAAITLDQVDAIGVGVPGQVCPRTGTVRLAANLPLQEYPLATKLAEALGRPVILENDVRAAAVGSYRSTVLDGGQSIAYVNVGTGVSAGLILEGKLYRGSYGMAGEIGHIVMEPAGPPCKCGARGCLETLVAGPALARAGQGAARNGARTLLRDFTPVTTEHLYQAAGAGDPVAQEITRRAGSYLGRALQALLMAYDVEWLVLGGGVTRAGKLFLAPILEEWAQQRACSPLASEMLKASKLQLADPETNMVTRGAAILADQALVDRL